MKNILPALMLLLFTVPAGSQSYNYNKLIAYPVPFKPRVHQKLTVGWGNPEPGPQNGNIKMQIYDINGDTVLNRNISSLPYYWNGRNGSGRMVSPGLYILKIEVEDLRPAPGDDGYKKYSKKIIRIIVQ